MRQNAHRNADNGNRLHRNHDPELSGLTAKQGHHRGGAQKLTREWWRLARPGFDCVLSQIVLDEIPAGDPVHATKRLEEAGSLAALAVNESCLELAQLYLERGYVPRSEIRDALHIAVAVIWKVDYLLTWNCKHIANAHALRQLRKFSENQGHEFPHVCTPEEL